MSFGNVYQQIRAIIDESRLTEKQKREFSEVFARTKEAPLRPVLKLFQENPKWVEILYNNYSVKKRAFVTGSMEEWRDIVKKEKEEITKNTSY